MTIVTKLERLREIALDQHGLVTTAQAIDDGVSHAELSTMVRRRRLDRAAHGVYRVPQVPATEFDQYGLAVLWTGAPEACLSHATALDCWDITDMNPDRIHMTVARRRRIRRAGGERYLIHHEDLEPEQITWWEGVPIVTAPTAIAQCISTGVPTYLIRQALERSGGTTLLTHRERSELSSQLEQRDGGS